MKTKIFSVGLALLIIASTLFATIPAAAGELAWGSYTLPSTSNNILVTTAGTDILDIAVGGDGNTIYAVTGANDARCYKSTNGGKTWSTTSATNLPNPANLVAVAPDDANVVVVAGGGATNLVVAVSTNGGSSWSTISPVTDTTTGPAGAAANVAADIDAIAISQLSAGARMVACAGLSTAGETDDASLYYFNLGSAVPGWTDAVWDPAWDAGAGLGLGFTAAAAPADTNEIDTIKAIAFSPYFASDQTAVAVSEQTGAAAQFGKMRLHIMSFNQKKWDATAAIAGYPVVLESAALAANAFGVNVADISLDPAYLGGDDSLRVGFVGASITSPAATEIGGIYRSKDTSIAQILADVGIQSVSWNGTNLVAGPTANNTVRRCADALASSPTISSAAAYKRPGIDGVTTATIVAWAGVNVVAGDTGNGSAFAFSTDNGATFTDVSLIDTTLAAIEDIQVASDGSKVYLLANNAAQTSLWLKTDAWYRVWGINNAVGYLARIAPDNKDVVYIADAGATAMFYSENGGNRWFQRTSRYNVQDLAVESIDVAYVAQTAANSVSKTTNKGFTWGDAKGTGLSAGNVNSINVLAKDKLIVGGAQGYVAYSVDGNANWTAITTQLANADPTIATATSLDSGGYIFAATDGTTADTSVQRWTIGTSTSWKAMAPAVGVATTDGDAGARGIFLQNSALYVYISEDAADTDAGVADAILARSINPTADAPAWDTVNLAADVASIAPVPYAMALSANGNAWVIDTNGANGVQVYQDTLVTAKPAPGLPAADAVITFNPISGNINNVELTWSKPYASTSVGARYDYEIALDPEFNQVIANAITPVAATTSSTVSVNVAAAGVFNPNTKYYWRVRTSAGFPVQSNWSDVRSFSTGNITAAPMEIIKQPTAAPPIIITQAAPAPAPVINLPAPVVNIPAAPPATTITIPPAAPAPVIAPAYIWAIVIIGAILVIAVIVLIIRTRRPV